MAFPQHNPLKKKKKNKLSLNVTKRETLLMGGRKKLWDIENSETHKLQIVIDQAPVSMIKHTNYLGIDVDQLLNAEEHISAFIENTSKGIGILHYVKIHLSLRTVLSMRRIIEPHFRFCYSV